MKILRILIGFSVCCAYAQNTHFAPVDENQVSIYNSVLSKGINDYYYIADNFIGKRNNADLDAFFLKYTYLYQVIAPFSSRYSPSAEVQIGSYNPEQNKILFMMSMKICLNLDTEAVPGIDTHYQLVVCRNTSYLATLCYNNRAYCNFHIPQSNLWTSPQYDRRQNVAGQVNIYILDTSGKIHIGTALGLNITKEINLNPNNNELLSGTVFNHVITVSGFTTIAQIEFYSNPSMTLSKLVAMGSDGALYTFNIDTFDVNKIELNAQLGYTIKCQNYSCVGSAQISNSNTVFMYKATSNTIDIIESNIIGIPVITLDSEYMYVTYTNQNTKAVVIKYDLATLEQVWNVQMTAQFAYPFYVSNTYNILMAVDTQTSAIFGIDITSGKIKMDTNIYQNISAGIVHEVFGPIRGIEHAGYNKYFVSSANTIDALGRQFSLADFTTTTTTRTTATTLTTTFYCRKTFYLPMHYDIEGVKKCKTHHVIFVQEGTTSIPNNVFEMNLGLKTVHFPSTLQEIGEYAFWGCETLNNIVIPNSVQKIGIGAFEGCSNLLSIKIPSNTAIGHFAFKNAGCLPFLYKTNLNLCNCNICNVQNTTNNKVCLIQPSLTGIVYVPSDVPFLPTSSFENCDTLRQITFEGSNITIETAAFVNCTNLQSARFASSELRIKTNTFENCPKLSEFIIDAQTTVVEPQFASSSSLLHTISTNGQIDYQEGAFLGTACSTLQPVESNVCNCTTCPKDTTESNQPDMTIIIAASAGGVGLILIGLYVWKCRKTSYTIV